MKNRMFMIGLVMLLFVTGCAGRREAGIDSRIERVENGLISSYDDPPSARMNLAERMAHYHVPGVSIAVINNHEIEWVKGYGVLSANSNTPVTTETLFQTASIAKPVVAAAALHLVGKGALALDEDVNQALESWQVPENRWTVEEKVTLRRLLSHSAGVTVSGFRGYAEGEAIPDLVQILDGAPPANSLPIRVDMVPGTEHRYSGGGYMIVQQLVEDVTGRAFPDIMQEIILTPLEMESSTFEASLPEEFYERAASGHRVDGTMISGGWHTYPEMGAGGSMWATPSDMAFFVIELMAATNGGGSGVITPQTAELMLTPEIEEVGLGIFIGDDGGGRFYFNHAGANDGYKSYMIGYPERGQGVVIMTNSDNGDALWREILNSVSIEYGWIAVNTGLTVGVVGVVVLSLFGVGVWFLRRQRARKRP